MLSNAIGSGEDRQRPNRELAESGLTKKSGINKIQYIVINRRASNTDATAGRQAGWMDGSHTSINH